MTIVYWSIKDDEANEKDIPHVYVGNRENGKKWKWIVDVDSIYIDNREKKQISDSGISKIFEKARDIDSEAQTPGSARNYSKRQEIWDLEKSHSQGVFRLVMRNKEDAILLADFISEVILDEFSDQEVDV
jgi:hypothetical protein